MDIKNLKQFSILVVDDDDIVMAIISSMIRDVFGEIYKAKDGKEGIKIFKDKKPDIVLTDIYMPNSDGFKMSQLIRDYSPKTPIIIASVSYDQETLIKAIDIGITSYIVKPIKKEKLLNILSKSAEILVKNRAIEKKNRHIKILFDSQPDITILTNGIEIIDANRSFFNFFKEYKSLKEFKKEHKSVVELFEKVDKYGNVYENIENKNWIECILENKKDLYTGVIKRDDKEVVFKITVSPIISKFETEYIVNLTDITRLNSYKETLRGQIEIEIEKSRKQEQIMFQQSKLASMGEMIGNIAHQWRQPLNALGLILQGFKMSFNRDKLNEEYLDGKIKKGMKLINKMSNTIDDFRDFFKPDKQREFFNLADVIEDTLNLLDASLIHENIEIETKIDKSLKIFGFINQISQVILNIINNSKDAFNERNIKNREINFKLKQDNSIKLTITDNAGGIKDEVLPHIFDANFTTKEEDKGSGVGLYMSKTIIHNMGGDIEAKNVLNDEKKMIGVEFIITFPKVECQ